MGLLRDRRDGRGQGQTFQMREKMLSIGDDYWIEDESGTRAFKVNGKAMRVRDTWVLEDAGGQRGRRDPGAQAVRAGQDRDRRRRSVRRP